MSRSGNGGLPLHAINIQTTVQRYPNDMDSPGDVLTFKRSLEDAEGRLSPGGSRKEWNQNRLSDF